MSTSTRSPAFASRQTKFNHRERPSGNRLESPAYQALVKLSGLLPRWGATAVPIPGWPALRICHRVPHPGRILENPTNLSRHLGNLGTWSEHPAGSPRIADGSTSGGRRQSDGRWDGVACPGQAAGMLMLWMKPFLQRYIMPHASRQSRCPPTGGPSAWGATDWKKSQISPSQKASRALRRSGLQCIRLGCASIQARKT